MPDVFHPVQAHNPPRELPEAVALRVYEVYSHIYGPQPAMIDLAGRGCRGGFSVSAYIAFLYAASFPRQQWRDRVDEALRRMG